MNKLDAMLLLEHVGWAFERTQQSQITDLKVTNEFLEVLRGHLAVLTLVVDRL